VTLFDALPPVSSQFKSGAKKETNYHNDKDKFLISAID